MPIAKIGPKHQVTIPKEIFNQLHLEVGGFLEIVVNDGKIVIVPKELTPKIAVPNLTKNEQQALNRVKKKTSLIQTDFIHSKGLTDKEAEIAVKVGLINPDQIWWWKEDWQKGEREAEENITKGEISESFQSVDEVINYLS